MKVINVGSFDMVDDPVATEQTINKQLLERQSDINTDYIYVSMPLAWSINRFGVAQTQNQIDKICKLGENEKLFFVCQHILVKNLNFHGNMVFTPHATMMDSFIPIPHYSCTYDLSLTKEWSDREYTFSFVGSFRTHPVRRKIHKELSDRKDCLVIDTGNWHFEGNEKKQIDNAKRYSEILGNTKYSLCPRGTGPSTIRLWESLAMGSVPVIVSDFLKMPMELEIDPMWLQVPENFNISSLDAIASANKKLDNKPYFDMFSNDNLYKSIVGHL
jgi:hypothetical protein